MIDLIIIILFVLWLGGFTFHIGGSFIHVMLAIALIVLGLRFLRVNV